MRGEIMPVVPFEDWPPVLSRGPEGALVGVFVGGVCCPW